MIYDADALCRICGCLFGNHDDDYYDEEWDEGEDEADYHAFSPRLIAGIVVTPKTERAAYERAMKGL